MFTQISEKIVTEIFLEIFRSSIKGFGKIFSWFDLKRKERGFWDGAATKYAEKLNRLYGQIRILGMNKPVPLKDIYIRVNILEKITASQRISREELEKQFDRDRRKSGLKVATKAGSEVVDELQSFIVLGKPGSGKSTFLKYIMFESLEGKTKTKRIPIFISLKELADSNKSLIDFIVEQFEICQFPNSKTLILKMLEEGKCQLLLDGLDEIQKENENRIIKEIRDFSNKYSNINKPTYKFTEESIENLKREGISENVLKKLENIKENIKDREIVGKTTFLSYVENTIINSQIAENNPNIKKALSSIKEGISKIPFKLNTFLYKTGLVYSKMLLELVFYYSQKIVIKRQLNPYKFLILKYSHNKYVDNQFIISCRIAAYNDWFEMYSNVEMADFEDLQIKSFINNWFKEEPDLAQKCWNKIKENSQIKELASIPLLLTLFCIVFIETLDFPQNRSDLYKEALEALLKKWDSTRRISRGEIYKHLTLRNKELLFSEIAFKTFEKNEYFFLRRTVENYIVNFIQNLPEAKEDTLLPDSENILKAIEAQHGILIERAKDIYSFSHLTFQEYYTAKYIVNNTRGGTLARLAENHITDDKWREVFLLTTGMLDKSDDFLMLIHN